MRRLPVRILAAALLAATTASALYLNHQANQVSFPLIDALSGGEPVRLADLRNHRSAAARDCQGRTPLMWAAWMGDVAVLRELLNTDPSVVDAASHDGHTALTLACMNGKLESVQMLLEAGADPNRQTPFGPGLHWAAARGHLHLLRPLVEAGADLNLPDPSGRTVLHKLAALPDSATTAQRLLAYSSNPACRSQDGSTPLDVALASDDRELAALLQTATQKPPTLTGRE